MSKERKAKYKELFNIFGELCPMDYDEFDELISELTEYRDNELYKYKTE